MTFSIQEKKGKWYVVVSYKNEQGKWTTKWHKTGLVVKGNKKRAEAMMAEVAEEYRGGKSFDKKWQLSDFLEYWYNNIVKNTVEITTWEGYGVVINAHLIPYFKRNMFLNDLTVQDIQIYFNEKYSSGKKREEGGLSPSFLKKHYSVLKRALDYAVKIKLIPINPILNVELPKQQRYNAKYYSVEQLEKLLEITKGTIIESVVFIAVHYGLRRGEILGMRYEDVDFKEKTITIRNTRTKVRTDVEKRPKSDASMRTLPLIPRVEEYLMKLKESQAMDKLLFGKEYNDNDYICKYADGTPVNIGTLSHKFRKILEKNQMPHIRFHDIRHSVASYLLKNGISLKEIQLWCGHSDIAVTAMFYTHVDIEMKRNTGNKINELFAS